MFPGSVRCPPQSNHIPETLGRTCILIQTGNRTSVCCAFTQPKRHLMVFTHWKRDASASNRVTSTIESWVPLSVLCKKLSVEARTCRTVRPTYDSLFLPTFRQVSTVEKVHQQVKNMCLKNPHLQMDFFHFFSVFFRISNSKSTFSPPKRSFLVNCRHILQEVSSSKVRRKGILYVGSCLHRTQSLYITRIMYLLYLHLYSYPYLKHVWVTLATYPTSGMCLACEELYT